MFLFYKKKMYIIMKRIKMCARIVSHKFLYMCHISCKQLYISLSMSMCIFYAICNNMHYIVSNGEDISKLYNLCWILLLFYDNKIIVFNWKVFVFFIMWLFSNLYILIKSWWQHRKANVVVCIYVLWFKSWTKRGLHFRREW